MGYNAPDCMYTWRGVETWQDISHPFVLITMPVDIDFSPEVPIGYHYTTVFTSRWDLSNVVTHNVVTHGTSILGQ